MTEQEWLSSADPTVMLFYLTRDETGYDSKQCPKLDRRLRLFACACCSRQVWGLMRGGSTCPDCSGSGSINRGQRAVEIAERYADGQATREELLAASTTDSHTVWNSADAAARYSSLWSAANAASWSEAREKQAALLRDIFGNPFRPRAFWTLGRLLSSGQTDMTQCLHWNSGAITALARAIYDERRFEDMPVLADALEEAGCTDRGILGHCRDSEPCEVCTVLAFCEKLLGAKPEEPDPDCSFCHGTNWMPLRSPHVRGCWVLDLLLGRE